MLTSEEHVDRYGRSRCASKAYTALLPQPKSIGFFAEVDVFYGHVLGFRGLERPVAGLAVNGFRELKRVKEMLHVGLPRARSLLVVVRRWRSGRRL